MGRKISTLMMGCSRVSVVVAGMVLASSVSVAPGAGTSGDGDSASEVFQSLDVVALDELATLRGGFNVGGLELEFGADVRTLINGASVLESRLTFTPDGPVASTGTPWTVVMSRIAPEGIVLPPFSRGREITVNDGGGPTVVFHELTQSRILSVLVSRASGIAARNEVELNVTIRNFRDFQQAVRDAILSSRLGRQTTE